MAVDQRDSMRDSRHIEGLEPTGAPISIDRRLFRKLKKPKAEPEPFHPPERPPPFAAREKQKGLSAFEAIQDWPR
eukprot:s136_g11.t1